MDILNFHNAHGASASNFWTVSAVGNHSVSCKIFRLPITIDAKLVVELIQILELHYFECNDPEYRVIFIKNVVFYSVNIAIYTTQSIKVGITLYLCGNSISSTGVVPSGASRKESWSC